MVHLTSVAVIIVGSDVPGEGEHKIIRRIHEIGSIDPNATIGIVGNDSDLITLSTVIKNKINSVEGLGAPCKIEYVRKNVNGWEVYNIDDLAIGFSNKLGGLITLVELILEVSIYLQRLKYDLQLLLLLLGNDYIPKLGI